MISKTLHARAREENCDEWDAKYAEADQIVAAAYRAAVGREATPAEIEGLSRIAVLHGKTAIIGEAIRRAAVHGAKSITSYVNEIIKDWQYQMIDSEKELAEYDYIQDCLRGKISGIDQAEALERLRKHREIKSKI